MSDSNLLNKSAVELKNLIQNKKISSIELTKLALAKIEETNHITNAFLTITHDLAINSAKLVDEKIAKGDPVGLLGGVPTSIKDLEPVKGYRTTKGSLFLENSISEIDQLGVERIKNEDGVILGKTNVPEFGASGGTENKLEKSFESRAYPGRFKRGNSSCCSVRSTSFWPRIRWRRIN